MKVVPAAVLLVALAGPALAQQLPNVNLMQDLPTKSDEEKAVEAERDRKYKDTLKKIPDAKASNDPWGGMRSDPPKTPAPAARSTTTKSTAAKKTKSATDSN